MDDVTGHAPGLDRIGQELLVGTAALCCTVPHSTPERAGAGKQAGKFWTREAWKSAMLVPGASESLDFPLGPGRSAILDPGGRENYDFRPGSFGNL